MKKNIALLLLALCPLLLTAQNCFNAGFETGTLEGYETYLGEIQEDGTVTIPYPGPGLNRHTIVYREDDPDPIAAEFCDINSILPPVPDGGGQFAMRLGNSSAGAQAERVLLRFTVTEELTYFLLHYAVVLNDPDHQHFEQPRFELRIRDGNGNPFPCGEYLVRAAEHIPGFETCEEGWRVRPWTAAGFELQSYLGQEIQIEILTTDCSQGAHAGYAYMDANCQPLQIEIDGYCPDSEVVRISVPIGFSSYTWSTGDTTNVIEVTNPVPRTNYSVTVTSATGCDLVLEDELPALEDLPAPQFDPHPDEVICAGESVWLRPTGDNLEEIFSLDFGYAADSFLVSPINPTVYTFIASDRYGCESDTLNILVDVGGLPIDTAIVRPVSCSGLGSIELVITEVEVESISWSTGQTGYSITDLETGTYEVTVTSTTGCEYTGMYNIEEATELELNQFDFVELNCGAETRASIEAIPEGGTAPFSFQWSTGGADTAVLADVGPGVYSVTITDAEGCTAEGSIEVETFPSLAIEAMQDKPACVGGQNGEAHIVIHGGTGNFSVLWDDPAAQQTESASGLAEGIYAVTVTDANNCMASAQVEITAEQVLTLSFDQEGASCEGENDGSATVMATGGQPDYSYTWSDDLSQSSATATGLAPGTYSVTVIDQEGCTNIGEINLTDTPAMIIDLDYRDVSCQGNEDGSAAVQVSGGQSDYTYFWLPPINSYSDQVQGLAPGDYTLRVMDANDCEQEMEFSIVEPAPIHISPGDWSFPDCDNKLPGWASVEVEGGNPPYRYTWETGDSTERVHSYEPGFFALTVTDRNECIEEGSAEVKTFELDLTRTGLTVDDDFGTSYLCVGDSIRLSVEANNELRSIQWIADAALRCTDCPITTAYPVQNTAFEVNVVDIFGCPAEDATYIIVNNDCGIYIPNAFSPNGDGMNDYFYVAGRSETLMVKSFRIFNRWGALVFQGCTDCPVNVAAHGWDGTFKGRAVASGVYVYAIELAVSGQQQPVLFKGDITLIR